MRLKSHIWVKAYLRRCQAEGCFAAVMRHGHDDAGGIYVRINLLNGTSKLYVPAPIGFDDAEPGRKWMPAFEIMPVADADVEAHLIQQQEYDPDLWVIEVEDREARHFLDDELH